MLGAHDVETDARVVRCPDWERGPGASLRCGLAALPDEVDAAVVVLADGPDLAPEAIDRVVAAWRADGGDVVAATYAGVRGHPVLLARAAWRRIPDEGARALEPRSSPATISAPRATSTACETCSAAPRARSGRRRRSSTSRLRGS